MMAESPDLDGAVPQQVVTRVLRFGAVQAGATLISSICQLAFVIFLARWYSIGVVGAYGVALAYYALFSAFTGAGFTAIIYRETAGDPDEGKRLFHLAVAWRLRLSVFLLVGSLPVMLLTGGSRTTFLFVVLGGVTNYVSDPALSYLAGRLRFVLIGIIGVVQRGLPLILLLAFAPWQAPILPGVFYFAGAVSTSLYILGAARLDRRRLTFDFAAVRQVLRQSWPLATASLGDAVALRTTTLLLGLFGGATAAGAYTPIASLAYGGAGLAYSAFQPLIAVLGARERPALSHRLLWVTGALMSGLLISAGVIQLLLPNIYLLFFGGAPSGTALLSFRLLVVGLVPWIMSVWFTIHMQVVREYRAALRPSLVGTIALVVIGVPLIFMYGIRGAAATSLVGDFLRMVLGGLWFVRRVRLDMAQPTNLVENHDSASERSLLAEG